MLANLRSLTNLLTPRVLFHLHLHGPFLNECWQRSNLDDTQRTMPSLAPKSQELGLSRLEPISVNVVLSYYFELHVPGPHSVYSHVAIPCYNDTNLHTYTMLAIAVIRLGHLGY